MTTAQKAKWRASSQAMARDRAKNRAELIDRLAREGQGESTNIWQFFACKIERQGSRKWALICQGPKAEKVRDAFKRVRGHLSPEVIGALTGLFEEEIEVILYAMLRENEIFRAVAQYQQWSPS